MIELGSTIILLETVTISERDSLTINGNGFAIDGDFSVRCLWINSSVVYLNELTVSNCYSNYNGGGLFVEYSFISMTGCVIIGNIASECGGGLFAFNSSIFLIQSNVSYNQAVIHF